MFEQIIDAIKRHDTVIIHRHNNPDGDAMGSQIGLKHIIKDSFKGKTVYCVGDAAKRFSFMEDSIMDEIPDEAFEGALSIILDCGAKNLVSDARFTLAAETARIDHHIYAETFTDEEVVDTSFESCCGMITSFAMEQSLIISDLAAKSLYTGMVTDSGRFRYDSTNPRTFRLAAYLCERNFKKTDVYKELYIDELFNVQLRASFISRIVKTETNVAYIYTTKAQLDECKADVFTASRGMVNVMSDIRGIDIWANFTENGENVFCEIRSSKYNINKVAVKYGGGGHEKASGATLKDRAEAMALLEDLKGLIGEDDERAD